MAVSTTPATRYLAFACDIALLLIAAMIARLPLGALLLRAGFVIPFSLMFAGVSWLAGDGARAAALLMRSYLSALAVLLLVGTTPLPSLLRGLEFFKLPRVLILVAQFLYRYLFVLFDQAQHMRLAARSRTGPARFTRMRRSRFQAAAGALSVLFARSHQRAEGIHRAMLARGFRGHFPAMAAHPARPLDYAFLLIAAGTSTAIRAAAG